MSVCRVNNWTLMICCLNRQLVKAPPWAQSDLKKKIKIAYLMYLQNKRLVTQNPHKRAMWTRKIFMEETRLKYGCGNNLIRELEESDPIKYFNYFRMSHTLFNELHKKIETQISKVHVIRAPIPSEIRLAITLRYLASGDSMVSLSYAFRISPQAISKIIFEVCEAIWEHLSSSQLKIPDEEGWKCIAWDFEKLWNYPHCIGALDGKHVVIQAPPNSGSHNYNYKNSHSMILMAVADANMRFLLVDIGAPGRQSDSGVFLSSTIGIALENKLFDFPDACPIDNFAGSLPYVLVGDEAFALKEYIMRPYPRCGNLSLREKVFNYRLSRARRTVECAFGILRGRWRVYGKPIIASQNTTLKIVQATVCLHNFIMKKELSMSSNDRHYSRLDNLNETSAGLVDVGRTGSNAFSRNAKRIRESFADYFEGIGAVEWQWEKAANNDF